MPHEPACSYHPLSLNQTGEEASPKVSWGAGQKKNGGLAESEGTGRFSVITVGPDSPWGRLEEGQCRHPQPCVEVRPSGR